MEDVIKLLQAGNGVRTEFCMQGFEPLVQAMTLQYVNKNSFIYREGEHANCLYWIQEGKVKISKTTEDGKVYVLNLFQDGDFFGQIDFTEGATHTFSAQALENCCIGVLNQCELEMILWQHGELAIQFMKWMGLMHRLTQSKLRDLILYGKTGALCSTLIRLSNSFGIPSEDGVRISFKLTNSELADYIGCARESVNRMLSTLKKAGVIHISEGCLTITNLDYLKKMCKCENCPKEICRI